MILTMDQAPESARPLRRLRADAGDEEQALEWGGDDGMDTVIALALELAEHLL